MNERNNTFSWTSLILGLLFLLGAYFAFTNPIETFASFAVFFAILTIIYGILQIARFIKFRNYPDMAGMRWVELIAGIFAIIIGIYFISNPAVGTTVLTALFAIWFLFIFIRGLFRAPMLRSINVALFWIALIINILGVILALVLIFNPVNAFIAATTMLAISLLFAGITLIADAFF